MIIHLLRHTKTQCPTGICYGQTDVELAQSFEQEKKNILENLHSITFTKIYSSPLKRCALLAKAISQNQEIVFDNRLQELNFGDWENKHWNDIEKTTEATKWFADYISTACPNGESYLMLRDRVCAFLKDVSLLSNDSSILIVTHGGVIRTLNSIITNIKPEEAFAMQIDYGQLCTLHI